MSKDLSAEIGFSFEAVLEAVQDSARGRWFLEELKKRSGQQDLAQVSDAITRIETRIEGMSGHFTAAEDLNKVRNAIAAARSDIQNLTPQAEGLSTEGRLFAHLADLARKSIPQDGPQAGVEKALRLVDQLDSSLNSNVMPFPAPSAKAADRFFQQDAAVFEQKPAPAVVQATPAKPIVEPVAMGAKLTITRIGKDVPPPAEPVAVATQAPAPVAEPVSQEPVKEEPVAVVAPTKIEALEPAKPRIVIIRRKPEETPEVPAVLAAPAA